jgi:hypothetical protein
MNSEMSLSPLSFEFGSKKCNERFVRFASHPIAVSLWWITFVVMTISSLRIVVVRSVSINVQ